MLFGCALELCTVEELEKIPPVLEYLLDSVRNWPNRYLLSVRSAKGQKQELYSVMWKYRPLVNELEQAWTGVEESDRAIISKLVLQNDHRRLLLVCPLQCTISKAK